MDALLEDTYTYFVKLHREFRENYKYTFQENLYVLGGRQGGAAK